jgi:hypothetical protein
VSGQARNNALWLTRAARRAFFSLSYAKTHQFKIFKEISNLEVIISPLQPLTNVERSALRAAGCSLGVCRLAVHLLLYVQHLRDTILLRGTSARPPADAALAASAAAAAAAAASPRRRAV